MSSVSLSFCIMTALFIGVIVKNLATSGAKIVVLSNSSRRASTTMEKLKGLGFDPSFFTGAITSGELTHQYLLRSLPTTNFFFSIQMLLTY